MGWFEFISAMTGHVAWPIAMVVFCLVFRVPITALLEKLETIGFGGAEAKFQKKLDQAEAVAVQLPAEPPALAIGPSVGADREIVGPVVAPKGRISKDDPTSFLPSLHRFEQIAQASPAAAIIDLWQDLERGVRQFANDSGLANSQWRPVKMLAGELGTKGIFPATVVMLLQHLNDLRNQAAHSGDNLTVTDAIRFRESALTVASLLMSIRRNNQ